jgi:hypothetical protein
MIINKNPSLLFGYLNITIKKMPKYIGFEERRKYFYEEMQKLN